MALAELKTKLSIAEKRMGFIISGKTRIHMNDIHNLAQFIIMLKDVIALKEGGEL